MSKILSWRVIFILYIITDISVSSREELDTWNILARARNEGRLFSRIEWPKDQEIVSDSI